MDAKFLEKIKILIVEDSDLDRNILFNTIKKYFPNIIKVSNGKEAYEIYKEDKEIDIIISDIHMPELSGIEFLKLVRSSDVNLPFILTIAKIEPEYILEAINLNVSSYLLKPIDVRTLIQKIDFLCEKKYYESHLIKKQKEIEYYLEAVDKASIIYKMTIDGNITYMNNAMLKVSGYIEDDIPKLKFEDIIAPEIPKKYIEMAWEQIKDGKLWHGNTKFIAKDGEIFYLNNTIFKINNFEEEFITIAFLTTKENLEKRDFHKKVLLNITEANKKEYELKNKIINLTNKLDQSSILLDNNNETISSLKEKSLQKERQLKHYELQGENLSDKYEKLLNSKKNEILNYIQSVKTEKKRVDTLLSENKHLNAEINTLRKKYGNLEDEIKVKNKRINELTEVVSITEKDEK